MQGKYILTIHYAGDDYIAYTYLTISNELGQTLWQSKWYNNDELYTQGGIPELREEMQIICDHNGIKCYIDSDDISTWKVE